MGAVTRFKFLLFTIVVSFILLSGQSCRYSDYLKERFSAKEIKEGEVCIKIGEEVKCGTQKEMEELEKLGEDIEKIEKKINEPKKAVEEIKEEVVGYLPLKEVIEGDLVKFKNLRATDPDGDPITYKFGAPLNDKGEWQTKEGDVGEYIITIHATDGKSEISQDVKIIVHRFNHQPVIEEIPSITVKEGEVITLNPKYSDKDKNQTLTLEYSGWMATNSYKTTYEDTGTYTVTITVSDGEKEAVQDVKITVLNVNRQPELEPINYIEAVEKDIITIIPRVSDPDKDVLTYRFEPPFDSKGEWRTKIGDHGNYSVRVTVSDGDLSDSKIAQVYVEYFDKPPIFEKMEDITVNEGDVVILRPLAFDPEKQELTYKYEGWMTENLKRTSYDDAGEHEVKVTVSDGVNDVSQTIKITVIDVNRPPIFQPGSFE